MGFRVMKLSRVVVLGVAGVAGIAAAFIALNLTTRPPPAAVVSEQVQTVKSTQVLVASQDIRLGSTVKENSVEWRDWPATGLSPKFIVKTTGQDQLAAIDGAIARASFYAGEPISDAKLIRSDQGVMAALLPKGMRAVATRIAADTSAGGFILPNDRVDVIMTRAADKSGGVESSGGNAYLTETILSNVRVLAIDQTIEDKDGVKDVVVGQTATLELTPQQAQILTVAQQMSDRLTLALRSIADSNPSPADGADAVHLIGGTKKNGAITVVRNGVAKDVSGIR
jgi:pilus assembly protein CpaB